MRTRAASFAAIATALMALGAVTPAGAGLSEVSVVTLNVSKAPTFRGNVTSPDRFCRADRKVVLYAYGSSGRYRFGSDATNAKGKWQLSEQLDGATTFQATVKSSVAKGLRCLEDSSGVKTVG